MTVAFIFPGQGSQFPGMLQSLPVHPAVEATMDEASSILQQDVLSLHNSAALSSTVSVQLALLVSGVAAGRALLQDGALPDFVAGHSVGAFSAAVISGALDFRDSLYLVKLRASLMENFFPSGYGMGVIVGIHEQKVRSMVAAASKQDKEVFIANLNSPQQITIAGKLEHLERMLSEARAIGARKAELLHVPVPSHCKLLNPVSHQLKRSMESIELKDPRFPYIANTNARLLRKAAAIRDDLACGVANIVHWHKATTLLSELGVRLFLEMPPGHILTSLAHQALPSVQSIALEKTRLDSAVYLVNREHGYDRA
ncbi:malonate decarboxylase epsilon subunit [Paenibacillus sp. yr247]|uniref:malonate decarboxylase subunit epsilon n=1 Tax=Paenibacillus sp. yr247 TaxID=1761880 RepID=UPI0008867502|nr:malonate decarboxylase subunit epsilon [Paenibacillus sp. yr247]SDO35795.1 malonate decarboxylase epsilon subunit [Paenibacillus sp. yr247]